VKYAKANSLRAQQAIARFGKSARHPLCLTALDLWRCDGELSKWTKDVGLTEEVLDSAKQMKEEVQERIKQFCKERKTEEANQAAALLRKIDMLLLKAQKRYEAIVKVRSIYQELRPVVLAPYEREYAAVVRTGDSKARRALQRVRKRWNEKKAFLGDSDRRTLEILKMLRDKASDEAAWKDGVTARYIEAARGGDRALSDEAWQGRLTAREIQSRLVDAPGDRYAKEVRRLARKLGIRLAEDQRGRKRKPYLAKQEPKRPRGSPRTKVGLEFHDSLDAVEAKQARKGKTPVRGADYQRLSPAPTVLG
jgi:hypothetical protein